MSLALWPWANDPSPGILPPLLPISTPRIVKGVSSTKDGAAGGPLPWPEPLPGAHCLEDCRQTHRVTGQEVTAKPQVVPSFPHQGEAGQDRDLPYWKSVYEGIVGCSNPECPLEVTPQPL